MGLMYKRRKFRYVRTGQYYSTALPPVTIHTKQEIVAEVSNCYERNLDCAARTLDVI